MKIFIFHANAGHGHRKVAETLSAQITTDYPDWRCEVHDALDFTPGFFRSIYPAVYYNSVKYTPKLWGWSYDFAETAFGNALIHPLRWHGNRMVAGRLLQKVLREEPDYVICTHFLSAQLLSRARTEGLISTKVIVVITDFIPHQFWVNTGTDLYWVMSTEGRDNLLKRGISADTIHVGGIPVENKFLPAPEKKEHLRREWGMDSKRMTLLVTSGSFGLGPTEELLEDLEEFSESIQALVVCGNNTHLKERLENRSFAYKTKVFGFVDFMADVMEAADLLIAKCGGSTTCESLAKEKPMVVLDPIPGQEAGNASVLKERGASFFVQDHSEIKVILRNILRHPQVMEDKLKAIRTLAKPRAVNDLTAYLAGKRIEESSLS